MMKSKRPLSEIFMVDTNSATILMEQNLLDFIPINEASKVGTLMLSLLLLSSFGKKCVRCEMLLAKHDQEWKAYTLFRYKKPVYKKLGLNSTEN